MSFFEEFDESGYIEDVEEFNNGCFLRKKGKKNVKNLFVNKVGWKVVRKIRRIEELFENFKWWCVNVEVIMKE